MNFELSEEQQMWRKAVHEFSAQELKPKAREVDEAAQFNWSAVRKMGPLGLLGLNVPEEFEGSGMDAVSAAIAIEELGWGCGSTALSISAHNGLGCSPLVLFGSQDQKRQFLPPVASGRGRLAALALTEPGAGSDLRGGVMTLCSPSGRPVGLEWQQNVVYKRRHRRLYYYAGAHRPRGRFSLAQYVYCPDQFSRIDPWSA